VLDFDGSKKARRREGLASLGILLLSGIIFLLPDGYQAPIRKVVRNTALRPFVRAQITLASQRSRNVDVSELRSQRDSLVALVSALGTLAEENRRLRELQSLGARAGQSFKPAEVLRLGMDTGESTFLLNIGSADGVEVNAPVIAPEGLLGTVIEVDEHTALAQDWTHEEFRASAMTADGEAQGMVRVSRRDFREADLLILDGAPFHTDIQPGKPVVTTGRGGKFPRGIPIGVVIAIEEADTGWRKSYVLRPAVRPEVVTHVMVGVGRTADTDFSSLWNTAPVRVTSAAADSARAASAAANAPRRAPRRDTTTAPPPTTTTGSW
jgi:rod shape-determining protein MreC